MTTERQTNSADILAALEACRQGAPGGTWAERCANLQDLLDRRRTPWRTPEELELVARCRRYLRDAGAAA